MRNILFIILPVFLVITQHYCYKYKKNNIGNAIAIILFILACLILTGKIQFN